MLTRIGHSVIRTVVPNFVASIPHGWNLLWFQTLLWQIWHEYDWRNIYSSKSEDIFNAFTRVKMLVWSPWGTNCWKLRENILQNILTAFSIKQGERQTRPCRAFSYYYSLQPNSRHTYNSVTSTTLSKTVSHWITAPKICIRNNVERPPILYISVVLKWIQWGHQLAKAASWDKYDSGPRHNLQLQWNQACELGWRITYKWDRV